MIKSILWSAFFCSLAFFKIYYKSEVADNLMVFLSLLFVLVGALASLFRMAEEEQDYQKFVTRRSYTRIAMVPYSFGIRLLIPLSLGIAGHPVLGIMKFCVSVITLSIWYTHFNRWEHQVKKSSRSADVSIEPALAEGDSHVH